MNLSPNYMTIYDPLDDLEIQSLQGQCKSSSITPLAESLPPLLNEWWYNSGQTNMAMERHLDWSNTFSKQPFINLQNQIRSLSLNLQPNSCYLQEVWNFNILTWQNVHTWWILWVQKHNMLGCNHPMLCWWICILDCGWVTTCLS